MQLFSGIKDKFIEYVDTRVKLIQLSAEEKLSELVSNLAYALLLFGVAMVTFVFSLVLIAKTIHYWTGSELLGYGFVLGLCLFLLWFMGKKSTELLITSKVKEKINTNIKNQHGEQGTPNV